MYPMLSLLVILTLILVETLSMPGIKITILMMKIFLCLSKDSAVNITHSYQNVLVIAHLLITLLSVKTLAQTFLRYKSN